MSFLLLAICASVLVSVFLKLAKNNKFGKSIDIAQAILINYATAIILVWIFLKPNFSDGISSLFINKGTPIYLMLGFLLPSVFIMMSFAVNKVGIVKSDMAQRLALFLPIISAFLFFGEVLTIQKIMGVILAFAAIICMIYKKDNNINPSFDKTSALMLIGVWFGYGVIDILLKQLSKLGNELPNTLFVSFLLAFLAMLVYLCTKKHKWHGLSLLSGVLLGVLNFCNILFYLKAHKVFKNDPTLVFAGMNIGVIALGAIVGLFIFKEKLSKTNTAGLMIGILAVWCLFYFNF